MKIITRFAIILALFATLGLNSALAITDKILEQKAIQQTKSVDGVIQIAISEKGFNQFFLNVADEQFKEYVKSMTVKIYDGYAEVTAVTQKPIATTLFVRFSLTVKNGKLYPKFLKTRYGRFPTPDFLMNFFIGKLIDQNPQDFQSTGISLSGEKWQSIYFKKGEVTAKFK